MMGWKCILAAALTGTMAQGAAAEILSREDWGARPALVQRADPIENRAKGSRRVAAENVMPKRAEARYLTVHHTARRAPGQPLGKVLQRFQVQMFDYSIDYGNGVRKRVLLGDLPYHFFIGADGTVGEGRELAYAAYSNTNYATPIEQHITVVLDGNFEVTQPSNAQIAALTNLLDTLSAQHGIPLENIGGHKDVAQTACPGKHLEARLPDIIATIRARR